MKIRRNYPQALVPMRKYGVGPSNTWKFELRISGPSIADPGVLRSLADQVVAILGTRITRILKATKNQISVKICVLIKLT